MGFRKTLLLCACVLMILGTAISGTLAYYTRTEPSMALDDAPTQEPQELVIALTQDFVDETGASIRISAADAPKQYELYPGVPFYNAVSITNTAASNVNAWVWYTCKVPKALVDNDLLFVTPASATEDWINAPRTAEGDQYLYHCLYKHQLAPGESTKSVVRDMFCIAPQVTAAESFEIQVTAHAIAAEAATVEAAFALYGSGQMQTAEATAE